MQQGDLWLSFCFCEFIHVLFGGLMLHLSQRSLIISVLDEIKVFQQLLAAFQQLM